MTEENYHYRTSPFLLRNQFSGPGKWKIPIIPKVEFSEDEFAGLRLIGFDRTNLENNNHLDRMVHFFLYDYKFERVWKNPDADLEKLRRYRAVLSPDFSMYTEMAPVMQLYNLFRNRWCGAYFASKGIRVVPTVSWGDESTFEFCFEGIPKGSTVAVSTYMVSAHGRHADQKKLFMRGYRELLGRVEPERVICYNEPFPEMEGNIVYVDYELSSWKYQNDDYTPSKFLPYICGEMPLPGNSGIVIKSGCVLREDTDFKGMGSAYGGAWQPAKPEDERFLGKPGEIKDTFISTGKGGYWVSTKIGPDGKAVGERHYTDHGNHGIHTIPHDHIIDWNVPKPGIPNFMKPQINYLPEEYPDGAPEFKHYGGMNFMKGYPTLERLEQNRFKTISDFKDCMIRGGEVEFVWKDRDKLFGIFSGVKKTPTSPIQILITRTYVDDPEPTELWCDTADEVLEYSIDGDRLRDIITKVEVTDRTI